MSSDTHPTTPGPPAVDLSPAERDVQDRMRSYVDDVLIPLEVKAELAGGPLPQSDVDMVRKEALSRGVSGGLHGREHGGPGWTTTQWFVAEAQLGRSTNGVSWYMPTAYNVWRQASPALQERWLAPALRGELHDAYAVTEALAGSDPSGIATTAVRQRDGRYVLSGEKWFVTYGSVAAVLIVMANVVDVDDPEGPRRPTLFAVPADAPGIAITDDPPFTHHYPHGHPTMTFTDVELTAAEVIGEVGAGDDMQRAWFTEERLGIAARCIGAMDRLLTEVMAWTTTREQGGARLIDHQGVSFPIADSAADAAAGWLLSLDVARLADSGGDPKLVHGRASMAKLFTSEAANRCADRAVQAFGGRGYIRTNVAERFWRELRVDRIWEGTSEIQRLIVARGLERRGVPAMLYGQAVR